MTSTLPPFTTHCPSDRAETLLPSQFVPNHVGAATCGTLGDPGEGNRRGVVCMMHPSQASDLPLPPLVDWDLFGAFSNFFTNAAVADGWVVDVPAYPADWSIDRAGHIQNFVNAIVADPVGNGQLIIEAYLDWWDHYNLYLQDRFGFVPPVVLGGFSMGSWATAVIAANAQTNAPVGAFMHALPTLWENISLNGVSFSGVNVSVVDIGAHIFDAATIPLIIGYSQTDNIVGWNLSGAPNGTLGSNVDSIITNAQTAGVDMTRFRSYNAGTTLIFDETNTGPGPPPTPAWLLGGGHLFVYSDAYTYCAPPATTSLWPNITVPNTTPALTGGWMQTHVDPNVPANTF